MKIISRKTLTASVFGLMIAMQALLLCGFSVTTPDGTNKFSFALAAGASAQGSLTVKNNSKDNVTLTLFGVDAVSGQAGFFAAKSENSIQLTVGKWLTFDQPTLALAPGEQKNASFHVTIPDKTPPGTYAGAAAVELPNPAPPNGKAMSVNSISRSIIPVYVQVPGVETFAYQWDEFTFLDGSNPSFNLQIRNTGNALVSVTGKITIADFTTRKILETTDIEKADIYQNDKASLTEPLDKKLLSGIINKYTIRATLDFSKVNVITGKNDSTQTLAKEITVEVDHFESIFAALGAILALIIIICAVLIHRRNERNNAQKHTVLELETIETIAAKENVPWKAIAHMNKLKPPYRLKVGSIILIPKSNQK
jgi:hypothetical protein